ncbi:MAG: glutamine-hydrolyzing GMP synthase, partial [Patescibacteria group bacterium]
YAHLIARRVRQLNVLAKIYPPDTNFAKVKNIGGFILSGGPRSIVADKRIVPFDPGIFTMGKPVLGFCYGHYVISAYLGGTLISGGAGEYGEADLFIHDTKGIFKGLSKKERVWMSHGDQVAKMPEGFEDLGSTLDCPVAAMRNKEKKMYGFQFHPEVHHTSHGMQMLKNYVLDICKIKPDWKIADMEEDILGQIKKQAANKKVFMLVSGGVDSTVAFTLLEKAIGKENVYGLHIDNGFMRLNESKAVYKVLKEIGFDDLNIINCTKRFLEATKGEINPEKKRQQIGEMFIAIANEKMKQLAIDPDSAGWLLGQGTIYPDTIESGVTEHADKIKTHHNRIDMIQDMIEEGKVIEPLADFYKDEVRELGKKLKIDKKLLDRHPFPGPGLAIRALCSDGTENIADEEGLDKRLREYLPVKIHSKILPLKSVGVQGDERTYRHPVILMGEDKWSNLNKYSVNLTNQFKKDINRVIWLLNKTKLSKDAKIKEATLTKKRLDLLREVDDIVMSFFREKKIYNKIWQSPVVLLPFGDDGESIVLRPIESEEAMTVNFYQMKIELLHKLVSKIDRVKGIDYIFYDITNKPPGTIEWE